MALRVTGGNDAYSLYNELFGNKTSSSNGNGSIVSTGSGYSGTSSTATVEGRKELAKALDAMKADGYTSFTFSAIDAYRKEQEAEFTQTLKDYLEKKGLDPETAFTLSTDASGNIKVICADEDVADALAAYFDDNPKMVEKFKQIEAMSNLKRAETRSVAQNLEYTRNLKATLRAETLQSFLAVMSNNGKDYQNQIASFESGSSSWLLGLNQSI